LRIGFNKKNYFLFIGLSGSHDLVKRFDRLIRVDLSI